MRQKIKTKLEEFVEIRRFANTLQRKELIDQQVRVYLIKQCPDVNDWFNHYNKYKEMYKNG